MSSQIQIAQDVEDERDMWAWLTQLTPLFALPRVVSKGIPAPRPVEEATGERSLVVFPAEGAPCVLDGAAQMKAFDGRRVTASPAARGCYFEWDRTREVRPGVYVVGGEQVARIYYQRRQPLEASAKLVEGLVKKLLKYVQMRSPLMASGKIPRFVGPHLAERIKRNDATLRYPNGTEIVLVPNPKFEARFLI